MTIIDTDHTCCYRCDHDLAEDVEHHLEHGGPEQCSRCNLEFEFDPEWLLENGYDADLPADEDVEDDEICRDAGELKVPFCGGYSNIYNCRYRKFADGTREHFIDGAWQAQ